MSQRLRQERKSAAEKNQWRIAGFVTGGVLSVIVLATFALIVLAFHVPPAPKIQVDPLSAQRLEQAFQQATASAQGGTASVVRTNEAQINSKVQQLLLSSQAGPQNASSGAIRDVRINLAGDHIAAYVLLDYEGRKLAFRLTGTLHTKDGYVMFEPDSATVGALPFPQSRIRSVAAQIADAPGSPLKYKLPANIGDIRVEDGKVVFLIK